MIRKLQGPQIVNLLGGLKVTKKNAQGQENLQGQTFSQNTMQGQKISHKILQGHFFPFSCHFFLHPEKCARSHFAGKNVQGQKNFFKTLQGQNIFEPPPGPQLSQVKQRNVCQSILAVYQTQQTIRLNK